MWNSIRKHWEWYLFGVILVSLVVGLTRWEWLGQTNGSETNSSTLRNYGLIGLPAVAVYLAWRRIKVAERQAKASEGNLQTARDALRHTEQKGEDDRRHNRYADASGRLSSDSVSARLGAIYELQLLTAQDPQQLHIQTMKLLCAFVRFPPPEDRFDEVSDDDSCSVALRQDVQAAMEVIGGRTAERIRLETEAEYRPDLQQANLVRLELREGNLSGIDMRDSRFWGADLTNADLSACRLQHAEFSSPWVLRGVELGALLGQSDGFFEDLDVLQREVTHMTGVDLSGALMLSAKLSGADLRGADMSGADLSNVKMLKASLDGVDFSDSDLVFSDLSGASLASAKLHGAKMFDVRLSGANLRGSNAKHAAYSDPAEGLTQAQLDEARADADNPPILDEESGLVWNPRPCTT